MNFFTSTKATKVERNKEEPNVFKISEKWPKVMATFITSFLFYLTIKLRCVFSCFLFEIEVDATVLLFFFLFFIHHILHKDVGSERTSQWGNIFGVDVPTWKSIISLAASIIIFMSLSTHSSDSFKSKHLRRTSYVLIFICLCGVLLYQLTNVY